MRLKVNIVHMIWIDGTYDKAATQEKLTYGRTFRNQLWSNRLHQVCRGIRRDGFITCHDNDACQVRVCQIPHGPPP